MLTVTQSAQTKIAELIEAQPRENLAVRLSIMGRGVESFAYSFFLVEIDGKQDDDVVVDADDFLIFLDPDTVPLTEEAVVDFNDESGGFKIENPMEVWDNNELGKQVAQVVVEKVNPVVASHGGGVLLVDVKDNTAYVRLMGGCQGCGMASTTLSTIVEKEIKEAVPEIEAVVDVTNHAVRA